MELKDLIPVIIAISLNTGTLIMIFIIYMEKKYKGLRYLFIILLSNYFSYITSNLLNVDNGSTLVRILKIILIITPVISIVHYTYLSINDLFRIKRNDKLHYFILILITILGFLYPIIRYNFTLFWYNLFQILAVIIFRTVTIYNVSPILFKKKNSNNITEVFLSKLYYSIIGIILLRTIDDLINIITNSFKTSAIIDHILYILFSQVVLYLMIKYYYITPLKPEIKDLKTFIHLYNLTSREEEVLNALQRGKTYKEIANELYISYETVKTHVKNVYKKTNTHSKRQLKSLLSKLI